MGLDLNLYARKYSIRSTNDYPEEIRDLIGNVHRPTICERIDYDIAYWGNDGEWLLNPLEYYVANKEEEFSGYIPITFLKEIIKRINLILTGRGSPDKLLPHRNKENKEYDEYYMDSLSNTKEMFCNIIECFRKPTLRGYRLFFTVC